MRTNATPETVRAVTSVFELAGIIDDRVAQPDKARIIAWSEQVHRHHLTEPDLLDGVQDFYDSPSERAIQVGDLIHHARQARRNRKARDEQQHQAQIAAAGDRKTADDVAAVAAGLAFGRVKRTKRLQHAETGLQTCTTGAEAREAIREYLAARKAAGPAPRKRAKPAPVPKPEGAQAAEVGAGD